jgi:hypothetical protein
VSESTWCYVCVRATAMRPHVCYAMRQCIQPLAGPPCLDARAPSRGVAGMQTLNCWTRTGIAVIAYTQWCMCCDTRVVSCQ